MTDSFHSGSGECGNVHARFHKTLGRFNWISDNKNWQLVLRTSAGNASALFAEDEEPDIQGLLPSDVLDLIEERMKRSLRSDMTERLQEIASIRGQIESLNTAWLADELSLAESAYIRAKNRYESQVARVNEERATS